MTEMVNLREYESKSVQLSSDGACRLNAAAGPALSIAPGKDAGTYEITASQYVGSIVLDEIQILITPKIRSDNLFLMLEVGIPAHQWRDEMFEYQFDQDLLLSVISFFARTTETALSRGLLRGYLSMDERLVALRGRIDIPSQIRKPAIASPIACTFDEYTDDNLENRYLKAALLRARRVGALTPEARQEVNRSLARMVDVSDVPMRHDAFGQIRFTRLNKHYEPALRLARLVLQNLTLLDGFGDIGASSFLVDMNELFQRFVTERLRRALASQLRLVDEPTLHLGRDRQVAMKPDLEFHDQFLNHVVYVGDIKYKLTKVGRARASDYYQLLAYCTALNLPEGVLVYCLDDGAPPERTIHVMHTDKQLHTVAIDLTGNAESVDEAFTGLAQWVLGRVTVLDAAA